MWPEAIILICFSALFSGLTLGMLSLDKVELEVVAAGEDLKLAACARRIIPVRKDGNLLLCTFLIGNTACNSLSSILMASIAGGIAGFLISTILILFLGEIIPQAVCSRYALQIGSRVICLVYFFRILFYPIAKPISLLLDFALGEEIGTIHTRQELSKLLQIHVTRGAIDAESGNILQGALHALNVMRVVELLTPVEEVYMLPLSATLDFKTVSEIFEAGFSRIPVYDDSIPGVALKERIIVAILFAKDLILVDPDDATSMKYFVSIFGRKVVTFAPDVTVRAAFVKLKQGHSHLALVRGECFLGVITLEDIVEEIIQDAIEDETDIDIKKRGTTRSKFRLLDAGVRDAILEAEEVKALAMHLTNNVDLLRPIGFECWKWVLQQSTVLYIEDPEYCIYETGLSANFALIVLTGKIHTMYQNGDEFEYGSFSVIASEALFGDMFIPNFTAKLASEKARVVVVKRATLAAGQKVFGSTALPSALGADPAVRHGFAIELLRKKTMDKVPKAASETGHEPRTGGEHFDGYESS